MTDPVPETQKRAPTLYAIITLKLLKGVLFVSLAFWLYAMSDNDLPWEYNRVLHFLRINPERQFWSMLADKIADLSSARVMLTAVGTFIYSLFSLVEGAGLLFRQSWAGWLAIGESAFFIPVEITELLLHRFTWTVFIILAFNILIVWYLYQNRQRLFRHHHSHHDNH
ncbi:MAG: DUF2127 domain-containing protein [Verrucomicrobiota bacterium]